MSGSINYQLNEGIYDHCPAIISWEEGKYIGKSSLDILICEEWHQITKKRSRKVGKQK